MKRRSFFFRPIDHFVIVVLDGREGIFSYLINKMVLDRFFYSEPFS
ncbi:MAG: hypothetical protein GY820_06040 [Gammaproteobacteria bacterium]|nr:hypothetical protein [Gammaproteobacteria bacterium]